VNPILRLRQRELLRLVAESNSTKQVAPRLGLSTKISNALRLVRYAVRVGLIP
jgi:DNA-binding CsgD family transcriptional regulator